MSENRKEISEMQSVEFAQFALQSRVAPPILGSVKARLRHACRELSRHERAKRRDRQYWTANRVKDCWYADPRITPNADEIRDLEEITGLRYGREELRSVEQLIAQAETLLVGSDADFHRPFLAAIRAMARVVDRSRTEG